MRKSLSFLVFLMACFGTLVAAPAFPQGPRTYADHVKNIRDIQNLGLSPSDEDRAIRTYIQRVRQGIRVKINVTDTNTRWRGQGDRPSVTGPKRTDALLECFEKCLANGNNGEACVNQCVK